MAITKLNKTKFIKDKFGNSNLTNCNVRRELSSTDRKGRPYIVELEMGDYISFRAKGTRNSFSMPLSNVLYIAMMKHVEERYVKKLERYKELRALGRKAVRPKKPQLVGVSRETLHALSMRA